MIEHAVDIQRLRHELRNQFPVIVQRNARADPRAAIHRVVEIILHELDVVDRRIGRTRRVADVGRLVGVLAKYVVDIPALHSIVEGAAGREAVVDNRNIDVGLDAVARITAGGRCVARLEPGLEIAVIRLVRDDADGAGHGSRAKKRALWTRQNLDALDIRDVKVEVAATGTYRLLIEIQRHVGHRCANLNGRLVR